MDVRTAIAELRGKLSEYFTEHFPDRAEAMSKGKLFPCVSPTHNDSTPSMNLTPEGTRVHCFGCHLSCDIFDLAKLVENLPVFGAEFYTKTVPVLGAQYGMDVETKEPTEHQANDARLRKVCSHALSLIRELGDLDEAKKRGFTGDTCKSYGIGTLPNYAEFIDRLVGMGSCDREMLRRILGFKPSVFGPRRLTFTIFDKAGNAVGFSARFLDWKKGAGDPKYDSTKSSPIFCKGNLLYGYHAARQIRSHILYVLESQLDCVLFHQSGVNNAVALGGTAFTPGQITLVEDLDVSSMYLCLDNDQAGINSTIKIIESTLEGKGRFKTSVVNFPDGCIDPAQALVKTGPVKFRKLKLTDAFSYNLKHVWKKEDPETPEEIAGLCDRMTKVIASEPSGYTQRQMGMRLSDISGFPLHVIMNEVAAHTTAKTNAFQNRMERIRRSAQRQLQKADGLALVTVLKSSLEAAEEGYAAFMEESDSRPTKLMLEVLDDLKGKGSGKKRRTYLPTGYSQYDGVFDGVVSSGVFTAILARSQSGKSTLIVDMIPRILDANPNLVVLYHTTDDPIRIALFRLVCRVSGVSSDIVRRRSCSTKEQKAVERAVAYLKDLGRNGRLEIRDGSSGYSLSYAERWIKGFRDKMPDRQILYVCDSLFNTFIDNTDIRAKVETAVNHLKVRICQGLDVAALCTVEPRKAIRSQARLTKDDAKETSKLELASHGFWIIHNGLPPGRDTEIPDWTKRDCVWKDSSGAEKPYLEVEIAKDKDHGEGLWRLRFEPTCFRLTEESCQRGIPRCSPPPTEYPASGFSGRRQ